jgi:chorismate synthase
MAGAVAKQLLSRIGVAIVAHTVEIGGVRAEPKILAEITKNAVTNPLRCADAVAAEEMMKVIEQVQAAEDSVGGVVEGIAMNVPAGLGEPVFDTLDGELAKALFAIPAVKGVEFGAGFAVADMKGSANNDPFDIEDDRIETRTNNAGGVLGGIGNGMPLVVRVAVKPTPSIPQAQDTVDIKQRQAASLEIKGRHDTCIVPRAVPVVEAMLAVTLCDLALRAGILPGVLK